MLVKLFVPDAPGRAHAVSVSAASAPHQTAAASACTPTATAPGVLCER